MRIAMIDPSLFTIPYDRELMSGLSAAGHDVRLYGRPVTAEDNDTKAIDLAPDFYRVSTSKTVAALPSPLRLGIKGVDHIASMLGLWSRFRRQRPDVIHFQWLPLPEVDRRFLSAFKRIAPLVVTVHDTNPYNGDPGAIRSHGFGRCLGMFDRLILHTQQGVERLAQMGIPASKTSILPFGLTEDMSPAPPVEMDGLLTFLMFGKIKQYKGIDLLIEAFASLPADLRANAQVRIIGKPYMPLGPLEALSERLGVADRVSIEPRFVPDDEVNALFSPNVVAVFPYREIEASAVLPLALVNACPVVVTSVGIFGEQITDGVQGLVVPPGDVAALSAALGRLIADRDLAVCCAKGARALAEASPDWNEIGRRTVAVYEQAQRDAAPRYR